MKHCVITSVGLTCNSLINMETGDSCTVTIQKVTGLTSTSWSTANNALVIDSDDDAHFYGMVTGQTSTLAAGDRIRVYLIIVDNTDPILTDPIVTISVLSE